MEKLTDSVSGGRVLWGPSLEVIARKVEDSVEPWAVKASAFPTPEKNLALQ